MLVKHLSDKTGISLLVDCDDDGYTSASLIYQYIKRIKEDIKFNIYIHEGKVHGLGDVIDDILTNDDKLVIIPDAGTGNIEECKRLYKAGKEVIILDHHTIDPEDNPAVIVNNQLSDKITDKAMTGVGITYKFAQILDNYFHVNYADEYLDLVCIGMIADRADLTNLQSRYYVLKGLNLLKEKMGQNKLLKIFVEAQQYSMNYDVTINGIGYYICPLMNSMIRLGDYDDKKIMFEALCNSDRKLPRKVKGKGEVIMSVQEYTLKACQATVRKQRKLTTDHSDRLSKEIEEHDFHKLPIVLFNAGEVEKDLVGLIANRLADAYRRPCILLKNYKNVCSGSARGYEKSGIVNLNKWCKNTGLFNYAEGHPNAFGLSIDLNKTDELINLICSMQKIEDLPYNVYGVYNDRTLNSDLVKLIGKYHYLWGCGIAEPLFCIKDISVNRFNIYLQGKRQNRIEFSYHNIKFIFMTKGSSLSKKYKEIIESGNTIKFDIIGKFQIDMKKQAQIVIEDFVYEKSNKKNVFGV